MIVAAEWALDEAERFTVTSPIEPGNSLVSVTREHRLNQPGTYFVALRGVSQREGNRETPHALIQNLGRMRLVVSE